MRRALAAAAGLCFFLTACAPHAREPEGLALARVLGVDGGSGVTLTALCPGQNGGAPVQVNAAAADFEAARRMLPLSGEREIALTNLSYLIVNVNAPLEEVLTAVLNDRELSPAARVWSCRDAGALLENCGGAGERLRLLSQAEGEAPTVVEALAELREKGQVTLPGLHWDGETLCRGEDGTWKEDF